MPECYCKGDDHPTEMELDDVASPADPRTGDVWTSKMWVCPHDCGNAEPYEPDDPGPYDDY